jgi:hypothetical protein
MDSPYKGVYYETSNQTLLLVHRFNSSYDIDNIECIAFPDEEEVYVFLDEYPNKGDYEFSILIENYIFYLKLNKCSPE